MLRRTATVLAALAVLGCQQILGIDAGKPRPADGDGGSVGTAGAGGAGGSGGGATGGGGDSANCTAPVPLESLSLGDLAPQSIRAVAMAGSTRALAAGNFVGVIDGGVTPAGAMGDAFVIGVDLLSPMVVSTPLVAVNGGGTQEVRDVKVDSVGNIYLAITCTTSYLVGLESVTLPSATPYGAAVIAFSSGGTLLWHLPLCSPNAIDLTAVAPNAEGNAQGISWAAAHFSNFIGVVGPADTCNQIVSAPPVVSPAIVMSIAPTTIPPTVAGYQLLDTAHVADLETVGPVGGTRTTALALAGRFTGELGFGDVVAMGIEDAFVAGMTSDELGTLAFGGATGIGGTGNVSAAAVHVFEGDVYAVGSFDASILAPLPAPVVGMEDGFVIAFDGEVPRYIRPIGQPGAKLDLTSLTDDGCALVAGGAANTNAVTIGEIEHHFDFANGGGLVVGFEPEAGSVAFSAIVDSNEGSDLLVVAGANGQIIAGTRALGTSGQLEDGLGAAIPFSTDTNGNALLGLIAR